MKKYFISTIARAHRFEFGLQSESTSFLDNVMNKTSFTLFIISCYVLLFSNFILIWRYDGGDGRGGNILSSICFWTIKNTNFHKSILERQSFYNFITLPFIDIYSHGYSQKLNEWLHRNPTLLSSVLKPLFRIRIRIHAEPYWFGILDPDPYWLRFLGSGSRTAQIGTQEWIKSLNLWF